MEPIIIAPRLDSLGEGPTWDSKSRKIYWVDIRGKRYHSMNLESGKISTFNSIGMISSIVPTDGNYMAATVDHGYYLVDGDGNHKLIKEIGNKNDGCRFNDGKADPFGNYVAGTMDLNEKKPLGSLYGLKGKSAKMMLVNLTISNGMAWDIRKGIFYHIDTPKRRVDAYSYDSSLNLERIGVAADFKDLPGNPDGMTIDADGRLWVAHWGGGRISVFEPDSGRKVDEIHFPAINITSCTFAGDDLTDLYVTSAFTGEPGDMGGSLFVVHTGIAGSRTYEYHVV